METDALQPLQAVDPPAHDTTGQYSRVTPDQAAAIVRLKRANPVITQREIAAAIGVKSASTVSYWLRLLENDTVPEARKLAKSQALRATMKIADQIDADDPRVSQGAAKAIAALAGVPEGAQPVQVGVQVVVGQVGQPAGDDPFSHNVMVNSTPVSD
jgi:transcriptional regulator with XRE-family HTH domain